MALKTSQLLSFTSYYVARRKTKRVFLQRVNHLIDGRPIEHQLEKSYTTGQAIRGRKAYLPFVRFKMLLLQTWYNRSDDGVEEQVNDIRLLMRFCGLQREDQVPDHSVYGYKRHYLAESKEGLGLSVHTTEANAHDGSHLGACLCLDQVKLPAGVRVLADTVYCSKANEERLRNQGLVSGIQRKAYCHKPLRTWAKHYNHLIGRSRYKIVRVFGSIKHWFGGLEARYVGLSKMHGQHVHVLEALAYNLYRLLGLMVSKS